MTDRIPTYREAVAIQEELRSRVEIRRLCRTARLIGGCDVAYDRREERLFAGVVVYDLSSGEVIEETTAEGPATFPYIPGLLSFREAPILLEAIARLTTEVDCLMLDGHGTAHPRRMGIACHLGVTTGLPAIGCAKKLLVGHHGPVGDEVGAFRRIVHNGKMVGSALRTRERVKPVYTSVGHRATQADARRIVLAAGAGYRLPEPTRLAHHLVTRMRTGVT